MMTEGSRVMAAYMKPLETGENPNNSANEMVDAVRVAVRDLADRLTGGELLN